MDINTYAELENQMNKICESVINSVSDRMLQDLKDIIKRDTYGSHGRNVVYESTYEFLNAWEWTPIKQATKTLSAELFYHWQNMRTEPTSYTHVDYVSGADNRERLADILNIQGLEPGNPIAVFRYSFWNEYILNMFISGKIDSYFTQEFSKFNIKK